MHIKKPLANKNLSEFLSRKGPGDSIKKISSANPSPCTRNSQLAPFVKNKEGKKQNLQKLKPDIPKARPLAKSKPLPKLEQESSFKDKSGDSS